MTGSESRLDTSVPHVARRYNYWLGGKDNFAADRESGDAIEALYPGVVNDARVNRRFHARAVEWLATVQQVGQFLDIGCGIPMSDDNTHDIAQAVDADARVIYVDNDPLVLVHARALLTSHHAPENVAYVDADLRTPEMILDAAADTLDMAKPVAVLLVAVMHFVPDTDNPYGLVRALVDALPAGSFLALTHASMELASEQAQKKFNGTKMADVPGAGQFTNRSKGEIEKFFDGLAFTDDLDVLPIDRWQPEFGTHKVAELDRPAAVYGGVACKQ